MNRKIIAYVVFALMAGIVIYFAFLYYASYSEGVRSGELVKFSRKGVVFKSWEGEIRETDGGSIFYFSVLDRDAKLIEDLKNDQGKYVKVDYVERYKTFPWWGDSVYFVTSTKTEIAP